MSDVISIVDGLDLVVSLAEGHVHPDDVDAARRVAADARARTGYAGGTLVVALVGGTGSGKSSILNALAGEQVAAVGTLRPHTSRPVAWIPADAEASLHELLGRLGVDQRVEHDRFPGLALLDLTDIDSVERAHRAAVEVLLPEVDGIVWVLDPQKYRDPVLHDEFIAPLSDSADRFVFVLNQIDRVGPADLVGLISDLRAALLADGVERPRIVSVAADPPGGQPIDIDRLRETLSAWVDAKRFRVGRIIADARRAARTLAEAAGVGHGGSLAFEDRWATLLGAVVTGLSLSAPGRGAIEEALCGLEDFVVDLGVGAGGPFGQRLRQVFRSERLEAELMAAIAAMEAAVPRPEHPGAPIDPERRAAAAEVLESELQRRIGAPLREIVWERASLSAGYAGLGVDLAKADDHLQRRG